jgi:hypothetical protein
LPSHGTAIAYLALFLALAGSGYAARTVVNAVTGGGPTVVTQEPAYTVDPHNNPNFLTPVGGPVPNTYLEEQYTVAEDSNPVTNAQNDIYTPLQSPSKIAGGGSHLASVQFCINISANSNVNYPGHSSVQVDKATVYELNEPNPGGGPGSGNANGAPAYQHRVALLQKTFTGLTQIDNCPMISTTKPLAINRNGYLVLAVTVGLTTTGAANNTYGTNYVQLGRVTTTYTP